MPTKTAPPPPPGPPPASGDEALPLDELVRRYLDLYQESWTQSLADPRLVEAWLGLARPFVEVWRDAAFAVRPPHGTEATAAPPPDGAGDVDELRRRVADLERRIGEIERAGTLPGGGGEGRRSGAGVGSPRASGSSSGGGRKRSRP